MTYFFSKEKLQNLTIDVVYGLEENLGEYCSFNTFCYYGLFFGLSVQNGAIKERSFIGQSMFGTLSADLNDSIQREGRGSSTL